MDPDRGGVGHPDPKQAHLKYATASGLNELYGRLVRSTMSLGTVLRGRADPVRVPARQNAAVGLPCSQQRTTPLAGAHVAAAAERGRRSGVAARG